VAQPVAASPPPTADNDDAGEDDDAPDFWGDDADECESEGA
jgi:hypothetical protein